MPLRRGVTSAPPPKPPDPRDGVGDVAAANGELARAGEGGAAASPASRRALPPPQAPADTLCAGDGTGDTGASACGVSCGEREYESPGLGPWGGVGAAKGLSGPRAATAPAVRGVLAGGVEAALRLGCGAGARPMRDSSSSTLRRSGGRRRARSRAAGGAVKQAPASHNASRP
jgi:hypothetical protein